MLCSHHTCLLESWTLGVQQDVRKEVMLSRWPVPPRCSWSPAWSWADAACATA